MLTSQVQMFCLPPLLKLHAAHICILMWMGAEGIHGHPLGALKVFLAGPRSNVAIGDVVHFSPRAAATSESCCHSVRSSTRVMKNSSLNESVGRG